jgi:succinyl-CoA synthetase beta subunit
MVNGAGLAMATMDIIKLYGASPPTSSTSAAAPQGEGDGRLQDHHRRPGVKGILVNIFGGIMRCDIIAEA